MGGVSDSRWPKSRTHSRLLDRLRCPLPQGEGAITAAAARGETLLTLIFSLLGAPLAAQSGIWWGHAGSLPEEGRRDLGRGLGRARRLYHHAGTRLGLLYPGRSRAGLLPVLVWRRHGGAVAAADPQCGAHRRQ